MRRLCIASFLQSCASGIWQVSIPYICKRFNGTDTELGLCMSLWFISYVVGCVVSGPFLRRFNAKYTVAAGAGLNIIAALALLGIVVFGGKSFFPFSPMPALIALSAASGAFTSLIWPPIMGWVSTGYEGAVLNKRLGLFNVSWSSGSLTTPYFAGLMVEQNSVLPVAVQLVFLILSLMAVFRAPNPGVSHACAGDVKLPDDAVLPLLPAFKWMSRIGLLSAFACAGLARTQLAVLFKFELNLSETDYGLAMLGMSIAISATFLLGGRIHSWHYKLLPFAAAKMLLVLGMVLILSCSSLKYLIVAAVLIGIGQAFVYTSHVYYGVSGGKNRSGRMAIHETTLALGIALGSMVGGILGDHSGRYSPYIFGLLVVFAAIAAEALIWSRRPKPAAA